MDNQTQNQLSDFTWDEADGDNLDFFGITPGEDESQKAPTTITEFMADEEDDEEEEVPPQNAKTSLMSDEDDDKEKKEESKSKSKDKEKDEKFFEEKTDEEKTTDSSEFYKAIYKDAYEKGIFAEELKEDEELDDETFFKKLDEEIESRTEEGFTEFMEQLSDDGKAFLKYAKNGGNFTQFAAVSGTSIDKPEVDLDSDDGQKSFLRWYYKKYEDMDKDDINDQLEILEDRGKLEAYAKKKKAKVDAEDAAAKERLAEQQAETARITKESRIKFTNDLKAKLNQNPEINGLSFGKKDKDLVEYITAGAVKLPNGRYVTEMQAKLADLYKDPDKLLLLAKLLKTDFDFSGIKKKTETEITRKTRTNLSRLKDTGSAPSSSSQTKGTSLADMF